ncbi:putative major facilitator superfamily transporter [Golovinomyces cichoracearum]|uniref:Putative major facilitator superfamily transporter n=1 Tax=Golovinomyces cichoracearum TaxID=62708 RepID=A0A420IFK7_9PEZI|nr:putative major facilitator superfamily transporter [Golovinomyces cichoracearum]
MHSVSKYLPFSASTTSVNAWTYLLAVCLFSISFLVFVNAASSFVITDLIGIKDGVGNLVGTLGLADEVVALIACPFWGILSDRIGVRYVCVAGYVIIGLSLFLFVQAQNVYPHLLIIRSLFSIGGAATSTMVTGILPAISGRDTVEGAEISISKTSQSDEHQRTTQSSDLRTTLKYFSLNSSESSNNISHDDHTALTSRSNPQRLAGLVGFFTGCGALVALILFLPLPAQFSRIKEITQAQAIADSFYVVGFVSLLVACTCFFGLKGIIGEEGKGHHCTLLQKSTSPQGSQSLQSSQTINEISHKVPPFLPYRRLLLDSAILGFTDSEIGLAYVGGFVARASSVAISLFIPTFVNTYFIQHGFCNISPTDPSSELKKECRAAYILAAELTGVSQTVALLFAPIFGYLSDRYRRLNFPILVASFLGIVGYIEFARLTSPETKNINGRGGGPSVFFIVALIGLSQIGAIVCSLGLLGRGILKSKLESTGIIQSVSQTECHPETSESSSLMPSIPKENYSRCHLKGSIAGVYSLFGGAAIITLTKLGGYLFDKLSIGAPFYIMAIFNSILLIIGVGTGIFQELETRKLAVEIVS